MYPRSSPGGAPPDTAAAGAADPSPAARGAATAGADHASTDTIGCTSTVYSDRVLHRHRYRIRHSRHERDRRGGSGSPAARNAHSPYESGALQRNVLGPRYWERNTQTSSRRLYPRLRRGAAIRPQIRPRDRDSGAALTTRRIHRNAYRVHGANPEAIPGCRAVEFRAIIAPR